MRPFRCLWLMLLAGRLAAAETNALGLAECYALALETSEALLVSEAEWRAAEARHRQALADLRPAAGLLVNERVQNPRERGGFIEGESSSTAETQFDARLRAQHTLFSGFRLTRLAEAGRAEADARRLAAGRDRELLYLDVSDAFHELLLRQRDLAVLGELEASLARLVEEVGERVRLGRSRAVELLETRAELAEARVELETARGARDAARELLSFLTGRPAAALAVTEPSPFPAAPDLEARLAGLAARQDLRAGEARVEGARRLEAAARAARAPELRAQGDVFLAEDPAQDREWSLVLTLELPVFDGGDRRARLEEARERTRVSELDLASLRRRAESDVRAAFTGFLAAAGQRARLREAVALARETRDAREEDHRLGRASRLEALESVARLHRLERREAAAEAQARASLVRLHVAAGGAAP